MLSKEARFNECVYCMIIYDARSESGCLVGRVCVWELTGKGKEGAFWE